MEIGFCQARVRQVDRPVQDSNDYLRSTERLAPELFQFWQFPDCAIVMLPDVTVHAMADASLTILLPN
jgi:hypothetical protein